MPAREHGEDELQLQLRRVRSEAEAARLDARAAEIELLLRQATRCETRLQPAEAFERLAVSDWQELLAAAALLDRSDPPLSPPPPAAQIPSNFPATKSRRRVRDSSRDSPAAPLPSQEPARVPHPAAAPHLKNRTAKAPTVSRPTAKAPTARRLAKKVPTDDKVPADKVLTEKVLAEKVLAETRPARKRPAETATGARGPAQQGHVRQVPAAKRPVGQGSVIVESRNPRPAANVVVKPGEAAAEHRRKRRPAAWIVSCVLHAALLLLLAAMTISVADPDDQITLDAAPAQTSEETIETVVFEQAEQPEESSPPSPVAMLAEVSPLGTILGSEIEIETPEIRSPSTATLETLQQGLAAGSLSSANLSQETSSEFFGAKGGGNHFVYLVDNSGSMATIARNGFDVARRELLNSIDALQEEQRFYVMFFGEEVLRMRIADPAIPEPRSVYATEANKAALRRWAMGITMQSGRWPEKALEFAFELRPDVIFLLTDGEMSQRAEPMIRENNLVENLFDGPHPRSIIHTVGFYSRDGAEQMQTIARVNGGTYHFIPPPPSAAGR